MLVELIQFCAFFAVEFDVSFANNNCKTGPKLPPPVNLTRDYAGVPGKRRPPGPPGSVTQCHCIQSNNEFRRVFGEVQNLMNRLQGEWAG